MGRFHKTQQKETGDRSSKCSLTGRPEPPAGGWYVWPIAPALNLNAHSKKIKVFTPEPGNPKEVQRGELRLEARGVAEHPQIAKFTMTGIDDRDRA